ncbi:MAG TPA: hypothetical protein VMU94_13245 [Streptosporangiaceae bacterium]|nr:hypothetical protein [Streptosporangiaceae bacterium]
MSKPNRVLINVKIRIRIKQRLRVSLLCAGWGILLIWLVSHPGSLPVHLMG